jgi:hypothetical protein
VHKDVKEKTVREINDNVVEVQSCPQIKMDSALFFFHFFFFWGGGGSVALVQTLVCSKQQGYRIDSRSVYWY